MKKSLIISILVLTLLVVFAAILWEWQRPRSIETILPEGPIYYARSINLAQQLDEFTATKVWQNFKQIGVRDLLSQMGVAEQDLKAYDQLKDQLAVSSVQRVFKKLFGKELAIALYPTEIEEFNNEDLKKMVSGLFVVTRLTPDLQLAEVFPQIFSWINKQVTLTTANYKNHKIYLVATKDGVLTIGYTRIGNLLVLGFGERAAKDCIDVLTRAQNPLSRDSRFLKLKSGFIKNANVEGFLNGELLFSRIKEEMLKFAAKQGDNADGVRKQMEENFKKVEGFEFISFSGMTGLTNRFQTALHFDRDKLSEETRQAYSCVPQENKTLSFIPQDVLGYQWSPCYDFRQYWTMSKEQMKKAVAREGAEASPEQMIASFEQSLGVSIEEDILPALGREIGGALLDLDLSQVIPRVKLLFFLQVADKAKVEKIVEALLARQQVVMQSEEYDGKTIKFFTAPILPSFQPGYVFFNDYLLLSTDREVLKTVIATSKNAAKGLSKSPLFVQTDIQLLEKNNSVLFIRLASVAEKAIKVVDWINQWAEAQQAKHEAFISGAQKRSEDIKKQKEDLKAALVKAQDDKQLADDASKNAAPSTSVEKFKLQNQLDELNAQAADTQKQIEAAVAAKTDATALQAEKTQLEQKISEIQAKFKESNDREAAQGATLAIHVGEAEKKVDSLKKEITDADSKEQELKMELAEYARQQPMPAELRETLINDLAKPLLRGLGHCPVFAMKTLFHEDAVEVFSYWKIE